jgi:diguanylate cyclase (GGDEF)-like protein
MRMNFSTGKKLFLSHFLATILVSGSIGSYFYENAIDNLLGSLQARLKYSAALLSSAADPNELDQIISPADKSRESYKKGVAHLRELVASNPDIAFINDEFGHSIGDDVLIAQSRAFENTVREQDIVARWGGEEFLILLPNTTQADAVEQAERLCQFLDSDALQIAHYPQRVTGSFGVCEFTAGEDLEYLLKQADVALYQAKAQGRNQVCVAAQTGPQVVPLIRA